MRKKVNGPALRALRLRKGLTIKDLAAKSNVSEGGIIKLESGETVTLQDSTLIGLSKGFGMDPLELEAILTPEVVQAPAPASQGEGKAARGEQP